MSGPELEKSNAIGWLDKLLTNIAISIIAVIPTFFTCVIKPWRLTHLLDNENPDGREGMLLAPGAFFPLSLLVSLIVAALLSTPETLNSNGSFLGPGLAVSVLSAASDGDIWKIVATIMPIYGVAVFIGLLGTILAPWLRQDWTLRVSIRAAFYVVAVLVSWMILSTAIVDLIRISTGDDSIAPLIYSIIKFPTLAIVIWIYLGFFRHRGKLSWLRGLARSVAMVGLILASFVMVDFIVRL